MTITEKHYKAQNRLNALLEHRDILDNKIEKAKLAVTEYENIIKKRQFNELEDVLHSNGLEVSEILEMVKSGNIIALNRELEGIEEGAGNE